MSRADYRTATATLICAVAVAMSSATYAQQAPQAYRPGLGDLMTATVQPRHIKLAAALRQRNWHYAAYELHELEEAFKRAAQVWPRWRSVAVGQMIEALIRQPMDDLKAAIKAGDPRRVATAYSGLTEACNACHQSLNRAMVVIREPPSSSFPDQDFRPARR